MNAELAKKPWTIISIASGKGGVGKTLTTVNLATTFAREGKRVTIFDGDLGLANVDVVLGLTPRYTIADVLEHNVAIENIVLDGPYGIKVIPSSSGLTKLTELSFSAKVGLLDQISHVAANSDILLIDTGAGIGSDVLHLNSLAHENVVVTTCEPHAITDAYAFIKVMSREYGKKRFSFLINMVGSQADGLKVFERLSEVSERYLGVELSLIGIIPLDPIVKRNVMNRNVINDSTISSISGQAWKDSALRLLTNHQNAADLKTNKTSFWQEVVFRPHFREVQSYS